MHHAQSEDQSSLLSVHVYRVCHLDCGHHVPALLDVDYNWWVRLRRLTSQSARTKKKHLMQVTHSAFPNRWWVWRSLLLALVLPKWSLALSWPDEVRFFFDMQLFFSELWNVWETCSRRFELLSLRSIIFFFGLVGLQVILGLYICGQTDYWGGREWVNKSQLCAWGI